MQQLSFDPHDPIFDFEGFRLAAQVITFENTYSLPPAEPERTAAALRVRAPRLTWAGGRRTATGTAEIVATKTDDGIEVTLAGTAESKIRCTKLILTGLPQGELIGHWWNTSRITANGTTVHYPGTVPTPLVLLALPSGDYIYFQSLDTRVRAKRFAVFERDGGVTVELIHEDAATEMTASTQSPPWRVGRTRDPEAIVRRHTDHVARAYGLQPWHSRPDVPAWMREISLIVALHGTHWSGYTFNTYNDMRTTLDYVADRIEGRRVLAFLPGWEGRYYWQYGDYRPEPLLGGPEGFARLAARARDLGVRLMPMFGANCANRDLPGYERWGAPSEMRSASGLVFHGNRPDWDISRAHDPGWQAWLNPGAPSWRAHLVEQVSALVRDYDLPAAFFDTQEAWINDPNFDMYPGLVTLRDELKARFPDLLVAGEGWYDALGAVTPLSQYNQPVRWAGIAFAPHNRHFLHLSTGDPSRGSTGVHELGHNPFTPIPDHPWVIPTLTVVDGTLTAGREGVDDRHRSGPRIREAPVGALEESPWRQPAAPFARQVWMPVILSPAKHLAVMPTVLGIHDRSDRHSVATCAICESGSFQGQREEPGAFAPGSCPALCRLPQRFSPPRGR